MSTLLATLKHVATCRIPILMFVFLKMNRCVKLQPSKIITFNVKITDRVFIDQKRMLKINTSFSTENLGQQLFTRCKFTFPIENIRFARGVECDINLSKCNYQYSVCSIVFESLLVLPEDKVKLIAFTPLIEVALAHAWLYVCMEDEYLAERMFEG